MSDSGTPTGMESGVFFRWLDERTKLSVPLRFLRAKGVPRHKHAFWYSFGGLALFFFAVQIVTGILLVLYYSPTPGSAHESIEFIMNRVPFGWLIRSLHSWSANLMIAVVLIHFFSVFFLKAYRKPREMMWLSGVVLLFLVLGFGFTGYLLPWDTKAYFATQIGTEIPRSIPLIGEFIVTILRGGAYIADESLKRMFALHVVILPLTALVIAFLHILLNQVHGPSVPIGVQTKSPSIPFFPNYLFRDLITWLIGLFVLFACALILPVSPGTKADPFASAPLGIKPEWYFLPLYQTLRFMPVELFGIGSETIVNCFVGALTGALFIVPFIDRNASHGKASPVFTVVGLAGLLYFLLTVTLAYLT